MDTKEEGWKIKRAEYEKDPKLVFVQGWCEAFAFAFKRKFPEMEPRLVEMEFGYKHVCCIKDKLCFDSRNLKGITIGQIVSDFGLKKYTSTSISDEKLRQNFCEKFPESRWEETIGLAEAWLGTQL